MTDLFNPETCMLMSAKDVQKKLDYQKPDMDFTSILNDIQSLICKHIEETPSSKLEIRLYDTYFNEKFKEAGVSFLKYGHLLMPVLVNLLEQRFGYKAEYSSLKYKQVTNIYENCLTIKLPDDKDKE
jgi:hypothetical protein